MKTDLYPSTFDVDLLPIAGGQDPVLATLEKALKRIRRSWTNLDYIAGDGAVCAIGAMIAADGKTRTFNAGPPASAETFVEQKLSDIAKEAITLLDQAAYDLHPVNSGWGAYSWAIERVNQHLSKKDVIACYQHAITQRQQARDISTSA